MLQSEDGSTYGAICHRTYPLWRYPWLMGTWTEKNKANKARHLGHLVYKEIFFAIFIVIVSLPLQKSRLRRKRS